jgi:hypothetical protein
MHFWRMKRPRYPSHRSTERLFISNHLRMAPSSFTIIDTVSDLSDMVDTLASLPVTPPSIYVDLEGIKLSRQGTISILQLYVLPKDHTYLVDIHQLQHTAFSAAGQHCGDSLKIILEARDIPKVFFDVRNDSDALFHHFQIDLQVSRISSSWNWRPGLSTGNVSTVSSDASKTTPR